MYYSSFRVATFCWLDCLGLDFWTEGIWLEVAELKFNLLLLSLYFSIKLLWKVKTNQFKGLLPLLQGRQTVYIYI